jgi:hypothetical protein
MADAADSKSVARKGVWVQVPPPAFLETRTFRTNAGRRWKLSGDSCCVTCCVKRRKTGEIAMRMPALGHVSAIWAIALATAASPGMAIGDEVAAQVADLRSAVRRLEKENQDLRSRLAKVEAQLAGKVDGPEGTPSKNDALPTKAAWRKLKAGMRAQEVADLLGDPERVEASGVLTFWYYTRTHGSGPPPSVSFSANDMTVYGWRE